MLQITIPSAEWFDESKQEFVEIKEQTLQLEHSLISISKWESKWCKPFLSTKSKTTEELVDYVRCMTLTQNVKPEVYYNLSKENVDKINEYIDAPMTATTFSNQRRDSQSREIVTSDVIYYWMIAHNIPFECQKWHLNRLLTLIRVCNIKNSPQKKMSKRELMSRNASLNAARRKRMNSRG